MCGGTVCRAALDKARGGLSPRVRGNPQCWAQGAAARRSIPACAGEPVPPPPPARPVGVYPRVCGGTINGLDNNFKAPGLSPRVRGEPSGKGYCCVWAWVYPRVCGGTTASQAMPLARNGLSPRVRGNQVVHAVHVAIEGSIPACAGEPSRPRRTRRHRRVYPRVCGGTPPYDFEFEDSAGLSPRVRGNLSQPPPSAMCIRSIPACAGEPTARGWVP